MPCYSCGTRQVDPEPGKGSPWLRGVRDEHQVLVCPDCQAGALRELDRCVRCDSTQLIRRLDEIECLMCGLVREAVADPARPGPAGSPDLSGGPPAAADTAASGASGPSAAVPSAAAGNALADEVARALDRVLGRR